MRQSVFTGPFITEGEHRNLAQCASGAANEDVLSMMRLDTLFIPLDLPPCRLEADTHARFYQLVWRS
jgi:hypothetical protein